MKRIVSFVLLIFLSAIFMGGCALISGYGDDEDLNYPSNDVRVISGSILEDNSSVVTNLLASDMNPTLKKKSGIKVYVPHDPSIFAVTDENGRFSLTVNISAFKKWIKDNQLPESDKEDDNAVPVIAEKDYQLQDGSIIKKQTVVVVVCKNKKEIDLDQILDSENNSVFWIKKVGKSRGTCRLNGQPAKKAKVTLYDLINSRPVFNTVTDNDGNFLFEFAPGTYKLVVKVGGKKELVINPFIISADQDNNQDITVPDVDEDYGQPDEGNSDPAEGGKGYIVPTTFSAPEVVVYVNEKLISAGQVVKANLGDNTNFSLGVFDQDSGLGLLEGKIGENELFSTLSARKNNQLKHDVVHKMSIPGTFTVKLTAKDFDIYDSFSPAKSSYVRIAIPKKGDAGFGHKIGVIIKNPAGLQLFKGIIIEKVVTGAKGFADFVVSPGDQVIPYIEVDMKNYRKDGIANPYEQILNVPDEYNNKYVGVVTEKNDGKFGIAFEDCKSSHSFYDADFNDCLFEMWFSESKSDTTTIVGATSFPTHTVDFEFKIYVSPIIVTAGKIAGHVIDEKTSEPISGALVALNGTDKVTITDENGYFELLNIEPGSYTIIATRNGYEAKTFPDIVVPAVNQEGPK